MTTLTMTPSSPIQLIAPRPRLLTGPVVRLLLADFAAMCSFYLLLSVVPLWSTERGIGGLGAGLSTAVLMFAAVAAELATPRLASRIGYRRLLMAGLVLLGAPALLLPVASGLVPLMGVCVVRGFGFAIVVVTVGALMAETIPAERRGEGLGVMGVVTMLPAVVALPLGVWLVSAVGYSWVFVAGALASLVAVPLLCGLPDDASEAADSRGDRGRASKPCLVPADVDLRRHRGRLRGRRGVPSRRSCGRQCGGRRALPASGDSHPGSLVGRAPRRSARRGPPAAPVGADHRGRPGRWPHSPAARSRCWSAWRSSESASARPSRRP